VSEYKSSALKARYSIPFKFLSSYTHTTSLATILISSLIYTPLVTMPGRLFGKVAIITGGGHGYGAGIARKYVDEGAKVVIADLSAEHGEKTAAELGCLFIRADVTKRLDWKEVSSRTVEKYGGIDIVVNNAGATYPNKVRRCLLTQCERAFSLLITCSRQLKWTSRTLIFA
jgi:hypothetical protein